MSNPEDLSVALGSVMAGLAEARSLSDRYSRNLSILYEQDDLLRAFPVPRVEINEFEINLRFAVGEVSARSPAEPDPMVLAAATQLFDGLPGVLGTAGLTQTAIDADVKEALEKLLVNDLNALVLGVLKGDFQATALETALGELAQRAGDLVIRGRPVATVTRDAIIQGIRRLLKAFQDQLLSTKAGTIQLLLTSTELQSVPEPAISTIRMVLSPRNYQWTRVDEAQGEPIRKLVPE